jgi:DNA polymerase elongation subunit (family B)
VKLFAIAAVDFTSLYPQIIRMIAAGPASVTGGAKSSSEDGGLLFRRIVPHAPSYISSQVLFGPHKDS